MLASTLPRADLTPDSSFADDTRLRAALQDVSGCGWGGAVYDVDRILDVLESGKRALAARDDEESAPR